MKPYRSALVSPLVELCCKFMTSYSTDKLQASVCGNNECAQINEDYAVKINEDEI